MALALLFVAPGTRVAGAEPEAKSTVSGVTVTGRKPDAGPSNDQLLHMVPCGVPRPQGQPVTTPYVVDSYPKPGQEVAPGLIFMRVTFSEPMSRCGFLLTPVGSSPEPDLLDAKARLSSDLRSFFFAARTQPSATYVVSFNNDQQPAHFRSLAGEVGAKTYELAFTTSKAEPVRSVGAALKGDPRLVEFLRMPGRVIELWAPRKQAAGSICGNCGGELIDKGPGIHSASVQVRSAEGSPGMWAAIMAPPIPPPGYHPGMDAF
ncbi:MAG: Ig-like domain-containing protein [Caulobacteraceae bacterium]